MNIYARERFVTQYVYRYVRDLYKSLDPGHDVSHFDEVVNFGMETGRNLLAIENIDMGMLITVLAFHDVGRLVDDEEHEKYSVLILRRNVTLNEVFTFDEIELMCTAITEHRSKNTATSIYAKILKDADKIPASEFKRRVFRVTAFNYYRNRDKVKSDESLIDMIMRVLESHSKRKQFVPQCEINSGKFRPLDYSKVTRSLVRETLQSIMEREGVLEGKIYNPKFTKLEEIL